MSDLRIKHTRNYKLFERSADNRATNAGKRRQLVVSMKKYGWLPSFPAVCKLQSNKRLKVLDGQHRIAIAETLGCEVYYVLETAAFDVAVVNSAQRPWVIGDYAHRYATQGNSDYREVVEFHEKNHVPIGMAAALLAGTTTFSNVELDFKAGAFKIKDRAWANAVAAIYVPLVQMAPVLRNARFVEACMAVCRVKDFDAERFLGGAKQCRDKLVSYSTRDAYLDMMEEIYNFRRRQLSPLKVNAMNAMKSRNASAAAVAKKNAKSNEPAAA